MSRVSALILDSDDKFPDLEMDTVDHGRLQLPDHFAGGWGVLLIYRAHW